MEGASSPLLLQGTLPSMLTHHPPLPQTIESRLQSDLAQLAKERSSLELLNQNLRTVELEAVRTRDESKQKSEAHITNLERDR